ncbi:DUF429 domain-containing protein [Rhodopirellula bahusiensis]|uniref:DUF429 domain-containing protein n=1 Tax=Rhodopirellula bahusiensis TaxID=2014065 RepID=UPI003262F9F2
MVNVKPDTMFRTSEAKVCFQTVFGVDFSGAALAGKNAWIAELQISSDDTASPPLELVDLQPLGRVAGQDDRECVYRWLTSRIRTSKHALWGMDFPFGLPVELNLGSWKAQLRHLAKHPGDAKSYGQSLVKLARQRSGVIHIRRETDRETQTPFDCYHYRIIYQTFHGMRDVLLPIADDPTTAVMPFQEDKLTRRSTANASPAVCRVVVEACPSSTLKRMGLPHQRYKQTGNKPIDAIHLRTRQTILRSLRDIVRISAHRRRVILSNPGGDALDAVLAGVGAWMGWNRVDHSRIACHARYSREGFVYC